MTIDAPVSTLIYSKNRACQLHLLLESWRRFVTGPPASILYRYTTTEHRDSYALIQLRFPEFKWIPEVNFRTDVLAWFSRAMLPPGNHLRTMMWLVDDQYIRRDLNLWSVRQPLQCPDVLCVSLRLSPRINFCYNLNGLQTPPPPLRRISDPNPYLVWEWREPECLGDWRYPMSHDGHVFRTHEVYGQLESAAWDFPNAQEVAMAGNPLGQRLMACYPEHSVSNIPSNLVQEVYANRTCQGPSATALNYRYLRGETIDLEPLLRLHPTSCHFPAIYEFVPYKETKPCHTEPSSEPCPDGNTETAGTAAKRPGFPAPSRRETLISGS